VFIAKQSRKGAAGKGKKARKTDRMAFFPLSVTDMRVGRMNGHKRVVDTKFRTLHAPQTADDRGLDDLANVATSSAAVAEAATAPPEDVDPRTAKTLSLLPPRFRWLVERIRKYGWEAMLPSEQQPIHDHSHSHDDTNDDTTTTTSSSPKSTTSSSSSTTTTPSTSTTKVENYEISISNITIQPEESTTF
jgi:hypothetical protein